MLGAGGGGGGARGRAAAGPRHAHLGRRQLDDHQLRVHAGAGGVRVRGAGAERQRRQAREVSRYYRCSFNEFWLVLEMGIYCSFDHKLFF